MGTEGSETDHREQRTDEAEPGPGTAVAGFAWVAGAVVSTLNVWFLARNAGTAAPAAIGTEWSEVVAGAAYVALASLGLFMVARGHDRRTGMVFLMAGLALALAALASEYAIFGVLTQPGSLPAVRAVAWFGAWVWWVGACGGITYGLLLYPDGSLPSARWRPAAVVATVNLVVLGLGHALAPGPLDGEYSVVVNPLGIDGLEAVLGPVRQAGWALLILNAVIGGAAVVTRWRRAGAGARTQLAMLLGAATAAVVAAATWGTTGGQDRRSPLAQQLILLALLALPLALAAATARTTALRRSVERLLLAREEERRRIRRDLHDGLGPTLAGVALQLDVARDLVCEDPETARSVLEAITKQVHAGIGDIRRLVDGLRPPVLDQLGLEAAIREGTSFLSGQTGNGHLAVRLETRGDLRTLPAAIEVTALRIVMEAVTNASRHGQASNCMVELDLDGALEITVEDDGRGLGRDDTPGVGLSSMRERAVELGGTCTVEGRQGTGTTVRARLPIREA